MNASSRMMEQSYLQQSSHSQRRSSRATESCSATAGIGIKIARQVSPTPRSSRCAALRILWFFTKKPPIYNPQGLIRLDKPVHHKGGKKCGEVYSHGLESDFVTEYRNYPRNLLSVKCERGLHPTQKPTALFEYLIRTYTNEGALVLDNCMGSGTTAVACIRSNRDFIGFEMDAKHFDTAWKRIESELAQKK